MRRYIYDIWLPLALFLIATSFTAAFYATYDPYASTTAGEVFYFCTVDGKVERKLDEYKPFWGPRLYFTVNIAFGKLSFSTVKIIDAAWDAIVGRGGQFIAATLAYPTLRRSLDLVMEACTVKIPAVTSLYCQQVHIRSVGQLVHTIFWHWGSVHLMWRQPVNKGRSRLGVQLFVCTYVLSFATLVSVMSGYRAQLSAYSGLDIEEAGELFPISDMVMARMVLYDGHRVNLSDVPMYTHDEIVYPDGIDDLPVPWKSSRERATQMININALLIESRNFLEPYGTLIDC